jgi:hypothetical protein
MSPKNKLILVLSNITSAVLFLAIGMYMGSLLEGEESSKGMDGIWVGHYLAAQTVDDPPRNLDSTLVVLDLSTPQFVEFLLVLTNDHPVVKGVSSGTWIEEDLRIVFDYKSNDLGKVSFKKNLIASDKWISGVDDLRVIFTRVDDLADYNKVNLPPLLRKYIGGSDVQW